eukprot:1153702-Pelagomonas_calceolata.AAC.17
MNRIWRSGSPEPAGTEAHYAHYTREAPALMTVLPCATHQRELRVLGQPGTQRCLMKEGS